MMVALFHNATLNIILVVCKNTQFLTSLLQYSTGQQFSFVIAFADNLELYFITWIKIQNSFFQLLMKVLSSISSYRVSNTQLDVNDSLAFKMKIFF